ncbi:hypothetical protein RhiJN_18048 [Ceratobasidium sp. AG-Ba]|nr:hypothetical protein RhiJN_18048 [Ceratobasidium sp. AG-Ba]
MLFIFASIVITAFSSLIISINWLLRYCLAGSGKAKAAASAYGYVSMSVPLIAYIYSIITTELIVARNGSTGKTLNKWSYGQVVATFTLGQQILDSFAYYKQLLKGNSYRLIRYNSLDS